MNRNVVLVLAAGAVAVAATVWLTYPRPSMFIADPSKYKFMNCPRCGRELRFDLDQFARGCPRCGVEMTPTEQPIAVTGRPPNPFYGMAAWILLDLVVIMGALVVVTYRQRAAAADEDYCYMNCPGCRQRIRYRERQVGQPALCPRCKRAIEFPPVDVGETT